MTIRKWSLKNKRKGNRKTHFRASTWRNAARTRPPRRRRRRRKGAAGGGPRARTRRRRRGRGRPRCSPRRSRRGRATGSAPPSRSAAAASAAASAPPPPSPPRRRGSTTSPARRSAPWPLSRLGCVCSVAYVCLLVRCTALVVVSTDRDGEEDMGVRYIAWRNKILGG
ncbi:Os06g0136201 [Oryza sativa Japonica Group]|uniref:Os06g0136201 protein n=1 Tax=Oryza sativa subsp. japonica TaxID=39947 RepID=A0A0P0WSK1_ORYSJ|nr:Os06g0136201 [Oryza sativa Japonica Group]